MEISQSLRVKFPYITRPLIKSMRASYLGIDGEDLTNIQKYLYLIPVTGQSLSTGTTAFGTVITTGTLDDALLFNGVDPVGLRDTPIESSFIETVKNYTESGTQTHGHSMLEKLKGVIGGEYLYAPHGKGASSVVELSPPSIMYSNGVAMMQAGELKANERGLNYVIPFLDFIQGESGASINSELRTLHDSYTSEANSITGQTVLPLILDQTGYFNGSDNAISRLEYCDEYTDAYMSCTKYPLNRLYPSDPSSDWTHLSPEGYVIQGEYHGIAGASVMGGNDFKTLQPISYEVVGTTVEITVNVPVAPLVIDNTVLPQCPSEGFTYTGVFTGDVPPTVTINDNKIILDIGTIPKRGDVLTFGYSLDDSETHPSGLKIPCGNIRDSQNIPSEVSGYTLYNWLVQFNHEMKKSEGTDPELWRFGDPLVVTAVSSGDLIAGANYDSNAYFEVGQVIRIKFKHNGTGEFRNRTSTQSTSFYGVGSEVDVDFTVTITDDSFQRNLFQHWGDGFDGTISDISVQEEL